WWLVAASSAQELSPVLVPRPSLSLHPSQGVSLGDNVTLRCHLPRVQAWVQLWLNGILKSNKEKDKEQDTAEFSFAVTNLEDTGTYQCRYQVSEPLWTSERSDPVKLVLTGAEVSSRGNLMVAVVRDCTAALIFSLSLYFILDACSLWTWRDESPGFTPRMTDPVHFQVSA
ncbi:T-cell-interacting, activating receptor on myeloid cells protein 1-like, partial [Phasianus colchicus]|uniref:T-cell-interacting, activating receptor on myeloid cells protein 1-like n=1 Tax=Phasianus colchicus TaxID=9054 RepID=UPI00129D4800